MKAEPEYGRFTKRLVGRTIELFQPHYGQKLSPQDACEIMDSVTSFIRILSELSQRENQEVEKAVRDNQAF